MSTLEILLIALILDYFIGDPDKVWTKIPHPAVLMGNSISWFDKKYNFGSARKIKGLITIFPAERYHSSFYSGKKDRVIVGVNFYTL